MSSKRRHRRAACTGQRAYPSPAAALAAVRPLVGADPTGRALVAVRCRCGAWHLRRVAREGREGEMTQVIDADQWRVQVQVAGGRWIDVTSVITFMEPALYAHCFTFGFRATAEAPFIPGQRVRVLIAGAVEVEGPIAHTDLDWRTHRHTFCVRRRNPALRET